VLNNAPTPAPPASGRAHDFHPPDAFSELSFDPPDLEFFDPPDLEFLEPENERRFLLVGDDIDHSQDFIHDHLLLRRRRQNAEKSASPPRHGHHHHHHHHE
jgi:hypothetical protein